MSDQPKPTGEWTVDENWDKEGTIAKLYCGKGESIAVIKSENPALFHAIRYLKRLHNAALAAAYRKGHDDGYAEAGNGLGY